MAQAEKNQKKGKLKMILLGSVQRGAGDCHKGWVSRLVSPVVHTGCCLSTAGGETNLWLVTVGQFPLLTNGVPPLPAPACFTRSLSQNSEGWRVLTVTMDARTKTQGEGVPDHQPVHISGALHCTGVRQGRVWRGCDLIKKQTNANQR